MVLGKLPVPGRPTIWITVGQGPTALGVGAGGGCLDIFSLMYPISILSPSLWETARYRLKYCLKGPLNPKQPINQPFLMLSQNFTFFDVKHETIKSDKYIIVEFKTWQEIVLFIDPVLHYTNLCVFNELTIKNHY